MKPTSVIFLIVSLILIIGGIVTCSISTNMAKTDGIDIFPQVIDENDNGVFTYDLSKENISKISLYLKDVEVNITGNSETSYIEIVNFPEYTYSFDIKNKILVLDDTIDVMSLFKLGESGFHFDGLRHFKPTKFKNKDKYINIYLSDKSQIKILDLSVQNGNVGISNILTKTDYKISGIEGNIELNNIKTASNITVKLDKGKISTKNLSFNKGIFAFGNGDFIADKIRLNDLEVSTGIGNVDIKMTNKSSSLNFDLTAGIGEVTLDSKNHGGSFVREEAFTSSKVFVKVAVGDINITS